MTELTEQISSTQITIPKSKGKLQNRITLLLVAILIPILVIYAWFAITTQQKALETLLLERAEATASSGAATISTFLEHAIQSGELTKEKVFDTNYQPFWEFDATAYPDFVGDPATLTKYHTEYDDYTDAHWQELIDPFLGGEDLIFAVPVDVNGYLPTHNTEWSSWDGSPETDRSKRIFNDSVGIKAARNTEPIIQQIYERPGTGETLWDVSAPIYVDGEHWGAFRVGIELAQNQERVVAATWQTIIGLSLVVFLISVFSLVVGRYVSSPIVELTTFATQAAGGDLKQHVDIQNRQEITTLAQAFNSMTFQLRDLIGNLETRVAARTQDLNLAAEIGRQVTQARQVDDVLIEATTQIKDQFSLYQVQIYLTNSSRDILILRASDGFAGSRLLETGHQLPVDERSINGSAAYHKTAVIVANIQESDIFLPHPLLPDTRSEMVVPLMIEDDILGVMDLQSTEANTLTEDVLPAFTVLAGQLAIAILNARQNRAMVENQTLMRTIIDATPDWIFVKNQEHRYQLVNQAYANSLHLTPEDLIGKNDLELGFPEEIVKGNPDKGIRGFWTDDQEIMASGETKFIPEEPAEIDGIPIVLQTIKAPLLDDAGDVTGIVGFVHDITNRKQTEAVNIKRAEELQAVAELSAITAATNNPEQLLQTVVDLAKERFNLYHAHIYLIDETEENLILAAGAGEAGKLMVEKGLSIPLGQAQSLVARAARTQNGVIVNDVRADTGFLPNPLLPGTRSEMAVPMITGNKVLGVFDVQADVVGHFSDEDVQIQTTLAAQTAVALQNARQYDELQRSQGSMRERESLLRTIIDSTPDWIFVKDLNHRYLMVNQGYANSFHMTPDDFIDKNDLDIGFPEDIVKGNPEKGIRGFWTDDREIMERGELTVIEVEPAVIDGEERFLNTIKAPLKDGTGHVTGIVGFVHDITDRIRSEEIIRERELLLRTIIDASPDQIIVKSRENRFLLVNQAFANRVGLPINEIIGKNDVEIGDDEELVKGNPEKGIIGYWPEDQAVMMSGQSIILENANEEGSSHKVTKTPLKDKEGHVIGLVVFIQDITSQKMSEIEQRKLAQALEDQLTQVNALQRAMSREGWEAFLSNKAREATGFAYSSINETLQTFNDNTIGDALGNIPVNLMEVNEISYNPMQTAVTMPLLVQGESIGVIGARSANGDPLTAEQQALLPTLTQQVAASLERARLFEETEIARSQTEALFTGSENVVRSTSLDGILAALVQATALKNMQRATLFFFNRVWQDTAPESSIVAATWQNVNQKRLVDVGTTFTHDTYPLFQFLQKDAPFIVEDFTTYPNLDENSRQLFVESMGLRTAITVPMVVGGQWIGFVLGLSSTVYSINENELRQIITLTGQAATVAQSQRLYQEASSRAEREQILRRVSDRVYAAPDAETVLRTAAREIGQALGLETFIYLEDPENN